MNTMKYSHIHVLKYYGLHNAALFAQRMVHKLDPFMSLGGGGGVRVVVFHYYRYYYICYGSFFYVVCLFNWTLIGNKEFTFFTQKQGSKCGRVTVSEGTC